MRACERIFIIKIDCWVPKRRALAPNDPTSSSHLSRVHGITRNRTQSVCCTDACMVIYLFLYFILFTLLFLYFYSVLSYPFDLFECRLRLPSTSDKRVHLLTSQHTCAALCCAVLFTSHSTFNSFIAAYRGLRACPIQRRTKPRSPWQHQAESLRRGPSFAGT
jgi:hypothetical protein